jgi:DNA-binding transcriptional MocR family regulator
LDKYLFEFREYEIPKYIQLSLKIKSMIDSNIIEDGEKLPSIRSLAERLDVNNVTVVNAYKKLENEGYAVQKIGSGTFAKRKDFARNFRREFSETLKSISGEALKEYIDFNGETACSDFFPVETFKKVLNEVLDRDGSEAFVYQEALGFEGLRRSIDSFFWNGSIGKDNILIVSGAQQGIDIVSKALINIDDGVILEKPTYSGALSVFKWRRANIFEVNMENDGIDLAGLEKIVKKNNIKCLYIMSYFQNPTGISCSFEKKKELLRLAEKYNFYIIEDDYLSELIYNSHIKYETLKSMDENDRVIYIKSFSKIFLPGIRIGYMIPPKKFKESIQNSKINTDISTSSLMQRALDLYINNGFWKKHIERLNTAYYDRYHFMEKCLKRRLGDKISFECPEGGLNFYLRINESLGVSCMQLFNECMKRKVLITPGVLFYRNSSDGEKYVRLGFSQTNNADIEKGISIINDCLNTL